MMKRLLKFIIFTLLITNLFSCALLRSQGRWQSPKVELIPGQSLQLPNPKQLQFNLTATQILFADYIIKNKHSTYTSQMQIEVTPKHIALVALAGWGGEVFSIDYNGATIVTSSLPLPNSDIGIQHVLTDFILTYADVSVLEQVLRPTQIKLTIKPNHRIFTLHGKPIITITYASKDPWSGVVILHNWYYNYSIKITNVLN